MNRIIIVILTLISTIVYGQKNQMSDLIIGNKYSFNSENLHEIVDLYIGLPKNYHQSNCNYPVHFVLDGQILFSYYYGVTDMLTKREIPECIIVGVQSVKRGYYFKPGSGSKEFANFLTKELIPFIDSTYRTNSLRIIAGHSTTGAFIVNTLLSNPDPFDIYLAGAPYHSELFLTTDMDSTLHAFNTKKYFYSFYGLNDQEKERLNWNALFTKIEQTNPKDLKTVNSEYTGEGHYSLIYRYIPDGLKLAFNDWAYSPKPGEHFSFDKFISYSEYQKTNYNITLDYSEGYFIGNAINCERHNDFETAIQLTSYGLQYYPNSDVLHNIIAVQYEKTGQPDLAKEHYRRILEIKPNMEFIKKKLKDLE